MSSAIDSTTLRTNPVRAFTYLFSSPNWPSNLLWLTLASVLQQFIVGSIFLLGYGAELIRNRAGHPQGKAPDIDSSRLGDYFMRGLWPFLAYLVAAFGVMLVLTVPIILLVVVLVVAGVLGERVGGDEVAGTLAIAVASISVLIVTAMAIVLAVYLAPVVIRGMITQDFEKSFDWTWTRQFVRLMFWDIIVSGIVFYLLSLVVIFAGLAAFCVGILPATGLVNGAMVHLLAQWYEVYLSRGGEPVPEPPAETLNAQILD